MQEQPAITLDIDWAPDWVIDEVAGILTEARVKATWFVTHASPAIDRLRSRPDLFELGMHPNFLPGSTHGGNEDEVLEHMQRIVPEATSMRTHSLHQNSRLLIKAARDHGVKADVSLLLPHADHLQVHTLHLPGVSISRVPFFWEDDVEMCAPVPCWDADDPRVNRPGLKLFNFHPALVVLNAHSPDTWERCKNAWPQACRDSDFVDKHKEHGPGVGTLFRQLASRLRGAGRTVSEIAFREEGRA